MTRSCLGVLLWSFPAFATSMLAQDVPALVRGSDAIVRGKVTRVESKLSGDRSRIFTEVEISVAEALKGGGPTSLVVIQPGGVVGEVGQLVHGLASFANEEEVVVFLERRGEKRYLVAGMAQGKYRVERSSDGRAAFAVPDPALAGARLVDPVSRQEVVSTAKPLPLDELLAQIRALVAEPVPSSPVDKTPKRKSTP